MLKACEKEKDIFYNINLTHVIGPVDDFDICPEKDCLAISCENNSFRLYNLKTAKDIYTFPEKAIKGMVRFNADGSLLATATAIDGTDIKVHIKIWDVISKHILHRIEQAEYIWHMNFMHNIQSPIFSVFSVTSKSQEVRQSLYNLNRNTAPTLLASTLIGISGSLAQPSKISDYKVIKDANKCLIIKKENCLPYILCKWAIANTQHSLLLEGIKDTATYQLLTDYEKERLEKKITLCSGKK